MLLLARREGIDMDQRSSAPSGGVNNPTELPLPGPNLTKLPSDNAQELKRVRVCVSCYLGMPP